MADGGYLVPPSQDPSKEEIWVETRKRLGRFLPDLFAEIFPDSSQESEKPQSSTVSSPVQTNEKEQDSEETATSEGNVEKKDPDANIETQTTSPEAEEGTS